MAIVLSIGTTITYVAADLSSSVRNVKLPPKISAYRVGPTVIIANWGDNPYTVRVLCLDSGLYDEVEVWPGTYLHNTTCGDVLILYCEYTIKPTRIS